jgi:DNA-binding MarR family transcriptional regulator
MENSSNEDGNKYYNLAVLIFQVTNILRRVRNRELDQYGLSSSQSLLLTIANILGRDATPAEISRWAIRQEPTISGILTRLEKKGLLVRAKDLKRENMVRIELTEAENNATMRYRR